MKTIIHILLLSVSINIFSQKEDIKHASINIISSGLTSSLVACFNAKNQKLPKVFINAFYKGCIGGSLNYAGKRLVKYSAFRNTYAYVWPARILNSLGSSIIYNGARSQKILSSVSVDAFFIRLTYDGSFHCQIDPVTLGSSIFLALSKDMTFNGKNTLVTGSMFFDQKSDTFIVPRYNIHKYGTEGIALGNTLYKKTCKVYDYLFTGMDSIKILEFYVPILKFSSSIATVDKSIGLHEIIHTFQYSNYHAFNALYIDKLDFKLKKYININLNFAIIYIIANFNGYRHNLFEKEADYFAGYK